MSETPPGRMFPGIEKPPILKIGQLRLIGNVTSIFAALKNAQATIAKTSDEKPRGWQPRKTAKGKITAEDTFPYAPFDKFLEVGLPELTKGGVALSQTATLRGNPAKPHKRSLIVWTWLLHESGGMMGSKMRFSLTGRQKRKRTEDQNWSIQSEPVAPAPPPPKKKPQPIPIREMASAITLAKRYSLGAMLALQAEGDDDDGEAADPMGNGKSSGGRTQAWGQAPVKPATTSVSEPTVFRHGEGFLVRTPREGFEENQEIEALYPNGTKQRVRLLNVINSDSKGTDWRYTMLKPPPTTPLPMTS